MQKQEDTTEPTLTVHVESKPYTLPTLWLRINDPTAHTSNGQRLFEIADVVNNQDSTTVVSTSSCENAFEIEWADGHRSSYPHEWLCRHVREVSQSSHNPRHLWTSNIGQFLPEVDYSEVVGDENGETLGKRARTPPEVTDGLLRLSAYLAKYGFVVCRNVPTELGMVADFGGRLGVVRTTNYGTTFDVVDLGAANTNLASTNVTIPAHTDNPYRDPFPGVQLLHCLVQASSGGATRLTDGFAAAEALRAADPEAFRLLSSHAHPFEYRDGPAGVLLRAESPVIVVDADGSLVRICFNNRSASVMPPSALPPAAMRRYYAAWARFDALCNSDAYVLRLTMKPGDLLVLDNGRVMHGRDSYARGAPRHLQGCYVDRDAPRSRVDWATYEAAARAAAARAKRRAATGAQGAPSPVSAHEDSGEPVSAHEDSGETPTALFDVHARAAERVLAALASQAGFTYGEGVNMLEHALQAAACATADGAGDAVVLACLLHDVGNTRPARDVWHERTADDPPLLIDPSGTPIGYARHAEMAGAYLRHAGFAETVCEACELHVAAKRALVAIDSTYLNALSQASIDTLAQQGGPMAPEELLAFRTLAGAPVALQLRRYDDLAKVPGAKVPRLDAYREMMVAHLVSQSRAPFT